MLTVREGTADDNTGLARLRAIWAAEQDPSGEEDPDFKRVFLDWAKANPRQVFVAEEDGELIGMLNVMVFHRMPKPAKAASCWVYFGNVYVLPQHRNAGIGGQLIRAGIEFSRSIGAARIVLSPSAQSRNLYERHGFKPAEELSVLQF
jgi:GNAT superfamily N-acetyltransferase